MILGSLNLRSIERGWRWGRNRRRVERGGGGWKEVGKGKEDTRGVQLSFANVIPAALFMDLMLFIQSLQY